MEKESKSIFEEFDIKNYSGETGVSRQYFGIAGITVCVEQGPDAGNISFNKKFKQFAEEGPGRDNVILRYHFRLPDLGGKDLGREIYHRLPWAVYRKENGWVYLGIVEEGKGERVYRVGIFNKDYTRGMIYGSPIEAEAGSETGKSALSLFPTDQVWIAPLLADRNAFYLHSSAAIINGKGLIFVGHSGAGKSTTLRMLEGRAEILCDDRNILRRWDCGWKVHGTWSHGELPYVSSSSAPLHSVLILTKDTCNRIERITDKMGVWKLLLTTIVKPVVTSEWWQKELDAMEKLIDEVPVYRMHFDKSGEILEVLEDLTKKNKVL